MLAFDAQRFPAGCQDMHLRRRRKDALRKRRRGLDHMLAAIEDQQHPPVAQEAIRPRSDRWTEPAIRASRSPRRAREEDH